MTEAVRSVSTPARHHAVRFYENDRSLSHIVAQFLGDGLTAGDAAMVVATAAQRGAIVRELAVRSFDVVQLQQSGDLVVLDASDTLATFMSNDTPDAEKFNDYMCGVIRGACRGQANRAVRIYGQMVDILWQDGQHRAAIRLEMLWNQLAHTQAFSLLCGYAMGHFYKDSNYDEVCSHHTHVISANGAVATVARALRAEVTPS